MSETENKLKLVVRYGDTCEKCGFSSCDHNEDPAGETCPGTKGNPGKINKRNYYDEETSAVIAALRAALKDARRQRDEAEKREAKLIQGVKDLVYGYDSPRAVREQPYKLIADLKALLAPAPEVTDGA